MLKDINQKLSVFWYAVLKLINFVFLITLAGSIQLLIIPCKLVNTGAEFLRTYTLNVDVTVSFASSHDIVIVYIFCVSYDKDGSARM